MPHRSAYVSAVSPEYALLGLLALSAAHGYELHNRLSHDLGQVWHISLSQIYNLLNRLEKQGFIHGTDQPQAGLPPRRRFQITPSGRWRFNQWLHTPSGSSVRAIRVEFITRLFFAVRLEPGYVDTLIQSQADETAAALDRLRGLAAGLPADQTFNRLGVELRLRQLESVLEWLALCRERLADFNSPMENT